MSSKKKTNAEQEMEWVDAWNDLYELAGDLKPLVYILPPWRQATLEECQGWIQDMVYQGASIHLEEIWHKGNKAIKATVKQPGQQ